VKSLSVLAQRHKKRRGVGRVFQSLFVSAASSQAEQTSGASATRLLIKKKKLKNRCSFVCMVGA
jgi:hypothetical protein